MMHSITAEYGRSAIGPRISSQNRTPYSLKCALLRTTMWPTSSAAAEIPGNIHLRIGSTTVAVFEAENAEVERKKISRPHAITGSHWRSASCSGGLAGIGGTAAVMMRARQGPGSG